MLSQKSWRPEGVLRLGLSLLVCICAGSLLNSILYYTGKPADKTRFAVLSFVSFGFMGLTLGFLQRQWTGERVTRQAAYTLSAFYTGLLTAAYAEKFAGAVSHAPSIGQMVVGMLSVQGAGLLLVAGFLRQQSLTWRDAFGFKHCWRKALGWGLIAAALFLPLARILQESIGYGVEHLPHQTIKVEEQMAVQTIRIASDWTARVVLGLFTIIIAPVAEEVLFRGIIYPSIKSFGFPRLAVWVTSFVFAAIHINVGGKSQGLLIQLFQFLPLFIPLMALALLLTWLYEKTENLLAPIAAHALFNAFNFALLYVAQRMSGM